MCSLQDSFLSNLLRLIHTMKPPKKKKKKKGKDGSAPSQSTSLNLDPIMEERKKRFPGLSIPDNTERAQVLMEPQKGEGQVEEHVEEHGQDVKVASEALDEVSPSTRSAQTLALALAPPLLASALLDLHLFLTLKA